MDGGKYSRAFSKQAAIDNMTAMATRVAEMDPDFVCIQEIDTDGTRTYHVDQTAIMKEKLAGYNYDFAQNFDSPYLFYPFNSPHGKNVSGIMTFSEYTITSALRRSFPVETGIIKIVDLDRCYSVSRIRCRTARRCACITHTFPPTRLPAPWRRNSSK
jgi:endonuclease/exonuclease/phosphatase family metal-dependent hydrolase